MPSQARSPEIFIPIAPPPQGNRNEGFIWPWDIKYQFPYYFKKNRLYDIFGFFQTSYKNTKNWDLPRGLRPPLDPHRLRRRHSPSRRRNHFPVFFCKKRYLTFTNKTQIAIFWIFYTKWLPRPNGYAR